MKTTIILIVSGIVIGAILGAGTMRGADNSKLEKADKLLQRALQDAAQARGEAESAAANIEVLQGLLRECQQRPTNNYGKQKFRNRGIDEIQE